jgi:hypothetical protein
MTDDEWRGVGDMVCAILATIYVDNRERFEQEAAEMGCTLEQFGAAAVIGMARERIDGRQTGRKEAP